MKNPYDILGINKDATRDQVKKAFHSRSKKAHPDKGGKSEEQQDINQAYAVLASPLKRSQYDNTGTVEDFDKKGMEIAIQTLYEAIAANPDDINRFFFNKIGAIKKDIATKQVQLDNEKAKLEKFRARIKKTPKVDFITPILNNQINKIDLKKEEGKLYLKSAVEAEAILSAYLFEVRENQGYVMINMMMGGTTSTLEYGCKPKKQR